MDGLGAGAGVPDGVHGVGPMGWVWKVAGMRVILHLDMDAFFASVEQRDDPSLLGVPVVVGASPERRGVVCAASYEARAYGVRSAMPSRTARRLCPEAVFLPPRIEHYRAESRAIFQLVMEEAVQVEKVSVDEAYLDATPTCVKGVGPGADGGEADVQEWALLGALPLARRLKARIRSERGLAATLGIAGNKLLAKVASDLGKPDGLLLLPHRDRAAFLADLPVRTLPGVGPVTEGVLRGLGLHTVGDIQRWQGDLRSSLGSWGLRLKQYAMGDDDRPLEDDETIRSISAETTFDRDTSDRAELKACLLGHAEELSGKLVRRRLRARVVQVKVRYGDFTTCTRQLSLEEPVEEVRDLYRVGAWLLARDRLVRRPLRLLGLGVAGLVEARMSQLGLFSGPG